MFHYFEEEDFWDHYPFRHLAPASQQALQREEAAKGLFHRAKFEFENSCRPLALCDEQQAQQHDGESKQPIVVLEDVVPPKYHLTSHTWSTFRRWVEVNHPGWKAKRRVATAHEIEDYEEESKDNRCPSKGKSYFISFVYTQHEQVGLSTALEKMGNDDDEEAAEEDGKKPAAKKLKVSASSLEDRTAGDSLLILPEALLTQVLSYCDVVALGKLVPMSKKLHHLAKQDCVWEPHLKVLLRELFDGSIRVAEEFFGGPTRPDTVTPLSQRDDWHQSTALLRWWRERRHEGAPRNEAAGEVCGFKRIQKKSVSSLNAYVQREGDHRIRMKKRSEATRRSRRTAVAQATVRMDEEANRRNPALSRFDFLRINCVSLREYYHRAGNMAFHANHGSAWVPEETCHTFCVECFRKNWTPPAEFRNLPKILWCF